jgi:hypothetical protein
LELACAAGAWNFRPTPPCDGAKKGLERADSGALLETVHKVASRRLLVERQTQLQRGYLVFYFDPIFPPDEIAAEIVENLELALEKFRSVAAKLAK